jgi:predicted Zn-dependent protease
MGRRILIGLVLAVAVIAYTYATSEEQQVPLTRRDQRVSMSDAQQQELGLQVFEQTLRDEGSRVITSGPQHDQVQRVSRRIAQVAAADKPRYEWDFALVDRPEANAFCLPGGKVVVFTGLLDVAKTDDELATVIGHEVAHAVAEHGAERIFREELTQRATLAASGAFADDPDRFVQVASLLGAGAQVGLSLPWGREQESESDRIGLIYMARAGYDPRAAISFWQRLDRAAEGRRPPEYLSTHPSGATRVRQIREWLPDALRERPRNVAP